MTCNSQPAMRRPTAAVLVIVDGLADIPPEATPNTKTLTRAAARGRCGLIDPVAPGLACGSDTAHLSIFGYDPQRQYRGRGAFEALGAKVPIAPGDIAFKCNLACLDSHGFVTARRPARGKQMHALAAQLCPVLQDAARCVNGAHVLITHASAHRCIVRLSGHGLSDKITNTDPLIDNRPMLHCAPVDTEDSAAVHTANLVNHLSHVIRDALKRCPNNCLPGTQAPAVDALLLRGASMGIDLKPFQETTGLQAFLIAPTKIIAGIGYTVGIDVLHVKGATGGYDTDLTAKAEACVENLMKKTLDRYSYELGIVHVKAVDEAAHDKCAAKKAFWIEQVDLMTAHILRLLRRSNRPDVVLCITGDHTSPTAYGDHTCEPVPFLICDAFDPDADSPQGPAFVGQDDCKEFCATEMGGMGSLGRFPANEITGMIRGLIFGTEGKKPKSKQLA